MNLHDREVDVGVFQTVDDVFILIIAEWTGQVGKQNDALAAYTFLTPAKRSSNSQTED